MGIRSSLNWKHSVENVLLQEAKSDILQAENGVDFIGDL